MKIFLVVFLEYTSHLLSWVCLAMLRQLSIIEDETWVHLSFESFQTKAFDHILFRSLTRVGKYHNELYFSHRQCNKLEAPIFSDLGLFSQAKSNVNRSKWKLSTLPLSLAEIKPWFVKHSIAYIVSISSKSFNHEHF